ncbi:MULTISPECIES: tetratricopeptide repeat protein [Spirulina sp. CCY15215]|uniref:tetratricopeptide repeat protein n=1 Tax=Spirulina sp. CCY15215 TaxID=2767591 RepID=UPI001950EFD6|nr:tetratricopeptide repeat protein [Spirulina major]
MAKKQKRKIIAHSPKKGFGINPQNIKAGVAKAQKFLALEKFDQALEQLTKLNDRYPDRPEVLKYLAYTYYELEQSSLYQLSLEQWVKSAPGDRDAFFALGAAYVENDRPFLALETFRAIVEKFPNCEDTKEAEGALAELKDIIAKIVKELDLEVNDRTEKILILHEKTLSALAANNFAETQKYAQQLLEIEPNFASALNNLSFAYWYDNQPEAAIEVTEHCLETNPDSFHAIANYIFYRTWQVRKDEVQEYAEQLKTPNDAWKKDPDYWIKAAEAFSWLEDDESVFDLYTLAETDDLLEELPGYFYHYLAAAHLRAKNDREARSFWEKALEKNPQLSIAQENLEDMKQPVGVHHSPWSFGIDHWLIDEIRLGVIDAIEETLGEIDKLEDAVRYCLDKYPALNHLIPQMIMRGSPRSRSFAFLLAKYAKTPEILAVLRDVALSDIGPDGMRHEAGYIASKAGLMPSGKTRMWIQGKWQEILLVGIEINDDMIDEHSEAASKLLVRGTEALQDDNPKKAEEIFKKALQLEPEARDFKFNLAVSYQIQERKEEMEILCQEVYDRDPNYPFARIALAKIYLDRKEFDKAEALIEPMMQWKTMNYQAFNFLCQTNIELALAKKQPDGAISWLGMWKQVSPDHPNQDYWEERIQTPKGLIDVFWDDDDDDDYYY